MISSECFCGGVDRFFSAGGRRYDRDSDVSGSEALGAECWDLMSTLVERLYDPDEQVGGCRAVCLGAHEVGAGAETVGERCVLGAIDRPWAGVKGGGRAGQGRAGQGRGGMPLSRSKGEVHPHRFLISPRPNQRQTPHLHPPALPDPSSRTLADRDSHG